MYTVDLAARCRREQIYSAPDLTPFGLLMPEEMEKAMREMPRDAEATDLLKKLSAESSLPAR